MGNKSSKGDLQRESQEPLLQPASNDEEHGERKENEQENQSTVSESKASTSKETPKLKKVSLGRLMGLVKPEWKMLFFATIMLIFSTTAQLAQPYFFGRIVTVASSDDSNHDRMKELNKYTIELLVILAFERLVRNLRKSLFEKIVTQDIAFFDTNKTGELMNRLSSDTAVIQSCLSVNISMGLRAVAEILVSLLLLFITSWQLTLVMMAVVPALMIVVILYGRFTRRLTKEYQDALAKAADSGTESISNARIMKSFGAEDWENLQYFTNITTSYKKGAKKAFAYGIFAGGIGFFAGFAILVVVYYGATLVIHDDLETGDLTAFVLYTLYIAIDMGVISGLYTEFMNALGASERIFNILDTKPTIPYKGGQKLDSCRGEISFEDISFAYPARSDVFVLKNFSFNVQPNQTVALVGASGSGKSTLLCLLERFYDVLGGRILIDGIDLRDLDPKWLHQIISIVPQEPVLFSGTIRSNIAYSRIAADPDRFASDYDVSGAVDEEIIRAGKLANAHDFIMSFPDGYNTIVGERGVRLSGGQKQRVAIARALLANPRILLLDEATSALDAESEMLVQDAINKLMVNRTVIIIAHRLSTVKDADVIAVFDKGKIVDKGRHEELLQTSKVYSNLVRKQLSWHHGQAEEIENVEKKSPASLEEDED
eukprot:gene15165-16933_t